MNSDLGRSVILFLCAVACPLESWAMELEAVIDWDRKVMLGTAVSGVVQSVEAKLGKVVDKETLLLSLDNRVFSAKLAQQLSLQQVMQRKFEEATRELERAQNYFDQDLSSLHELEIAKISHDTAAAEFKAAQAELAKAEYELQYASVRAPFRGIVLALHAQVGQVVVALQTAPTLIEFADVTRLKAVARVDAANLPKLKPGQTASLHFPGKNRGRTFKGEVVAVGLEPLSRKGSEGLRYPIAISFETNEILIPIGSQVRVQIP